MFKTIFLLYLLIPPKVGSDILNACHNKMSQGLEGCVTRNSVRSFPRTRVAKVYFFLYIFLERTGVLFNIKTGKSFCKYNLIVLGRLYIYIGRYIYLNIVSTSGAVKTFRRVTLYSLLLVYALYIYSLSILYATANRIPFTFDSE